jgi:murein DD-endopeptidase MepM/ murein hydrolase activator NlpD
MRPRRKQSGFPLAGLTVILLAILAVPVVPAIAGESAKQAKDLPAETPLPPVDTSQPPDLVPVAILGTTPESGNRPPSYKAPLQLRPEDHFWFDRPVPSTAVNWIDTEYRYSTTHFGEMESHSGVDIPAAAGTPVLAAADGVVVWAGFGLFGHGQNPNDPYGNAVSIKHDFGYLGQPVYSVYGHMSEVDVIYGQRVSAGQQIGKVGSTGKVTGPHLHFEVRVGGDSYYMTRNPELWLVPPQGYGVLAGRIESADSWLMPGYTFRLKQLEDGPNWTLATYAGNVYHSDDIYQENFAVSDLPAGSYLIDTWVWWVHYYFIVDIAPGQTTYVVIHSGKDPLINPQIAIP